MDSGQWRDLILYVCTALLIIPVFVVAQERWSAEDIYLFVAAFGAMGHHLPGMIRAYGDRALFQRFRWRFIFAPIFLVVVCATSFLWDLKNIVLIAFIWGVWHGMMQTYGFGRIYDAKVGSFAWAMLMRRGSKTPNMIREMFVKSREHFSSNSRAEDFEQDWSNASGLTRAVAGRAVSSCRV